jgi:predicted dehydrogenase
MAVGSRTAVTASRFAGETGVPIAHSSTEDLVADSEVDAVYVASPHPWHAEQALAAIAAGKAVLIEKPIAMTADEARRIADAAAAAGVFCMEAMWTAFLPHAVRIRDLIADGAIGEVRLVTADLGQSFEPDDGHRLFSPALGGGARLDMGVYPVFWAHMVLGEPDGVVAASEPAHTGVDATTSAVLRYSGGRHAVVTTTLTAATPSRATITGTDGVIDVDPAFYTTTSFTLRGPGRRDERFSTPTLAGPGKGMRFEAEEVRRCLRAGVTASDVLPLSASVAVMRTLDEIARRAGEEVRGS